MLIQKLVALTVSAWWRHHWSCVDIRVCCSKIKVRLAIPPAFLLSIVPHVWMLPVNPGCYGELIGNITNSCFEGWEEEKLPLIGRISLYIMIFKSLFKHNVSFLPRTSPAWSKQLNFKMKLGGHYRLGCSYVKYAGETIHSLWFQFHSPHFIKV